jgi:hypothetical protein
MALGKNGPEDRSTWANGPEDRSTGICRIRQVAEIGKRC